MTKAQKFSRVIDDAEDEELGEDSVLLESPLDKIEPYQLFKQTLLSKTSPRASRLSNRTKILILIPYRTASRAPSILWNLDSSSVRRGAEHAAGHHGKS